MLADGQIRVIISLGFFHPQSQHKFNSVMHMESASGNNCINILFREFCLDNKRRKCVSICGIDCYVPLDDGFACEFY